MKIIFYCCEFAPEGKTGSIRPSKFAKYFDLMGINVEIITKEVGDATYSDLLKPISKLKIKRVKIKKFLPINDDGFWFALYSAFTLARAVRNSRPDFIFVSVPVFLPMVSAYVISKLYGTKLILDYRDLWAADPYPPKSFKDKALRIFAKIIEPKVMNHAAINTFVSSNMLDDQEIEYGSIPNSFVISTGFDSNDFSNLSSNSKIFSSNSYRYYSHIGMLDWDMNVKELMALIREVKISNQNDKVRFVFIGGKNNLIQNHFDEYGIGDICEFIDTVDKGTAIDIAKKSDGLLILGSSSSQRLNRKVFESIACSDNIFYFGNRSSPTAQILSENNIKLIFDKDSDEFHVKQGIQEFISSTNRRERIPESLDKYKKSNLAKQYYELMRKKM